MEFEIVHVFDADRERVENAMFEEGLTPFLLKNMSLIREIDRQEQKEDPLHASRKVRYVPVPMISSVGPYDVRPEWMSWIETSTLHRLAHEMDYVNTPTVPQVAGLLEQRGRIRFEADGERTRRVITGVLNVALPIVGTVAERVIYANAIKLLDEEAKVLGEYLLETRE